MRLGSISTAVLVTMGGLFWASAASANMEDITACTNITDDAARLTCFDNAVPGVQAELAVEDETQRAELENERDQRSFFGLPRLSLPNVLRRRETTAEEFGSAAMDQRNAERDGTVDELLEEEGVIQEVTANVVEWGQNPYGKYFVVLDNGHVWRQTDDGRFPLRQGQQNTVRITRTRLGGFMLRVNSNTRTFRVQRVR